MIYITEVRMEPPAKNHGHIAAVRWVKVDSPESGETSRVEMVEWLGTRTDVARVRDSKGKELNVHAVHPKKGRAHIRSHNQDGEATDTLLTLPRYGVKP
jgi:hypothetical protein